MGAPKQKWTAEEEAALKAGVIKHGAGKWRTILKILNLVVSCLCDQMWISRLGLLPFSSQDKWRNMSVMANGWSSREKSKLAVKRVHHVPKQEENPTAFYTVAQSDEDISDTKSIVVANSTMQTTGPKRTTVRLDNLIMEAITSLKKPGGSNKTTIAAYIEEQYWPPHDFRRILSAKLKYLTSNGKLIKVKRKYRIAPTSTFSDRRRNSSMLFLEARQRISPRVEKDDSNMLTKSQIDSELAKMRTMTAQEAAAAAARAVAEAEAAIAEAEEATREAEAAEAAQAFAEAAMKTLKSRTPPNMTFNICDAVFWGSWPTFTILLIRTQSLFSDMAANSAGNESLVARIQQLEHVERDELHKDIEQLCTQQAGPSYLVVATKMHFQRRLRLEKKLAACARDNLNLLEELSEAYRIKNMEAEKQVKFFQGCVASAFAERDHAIMEAEKAKRKRS
ncbi:hypothetical protein GH714_031401 [Hevea brasiliensis]|uniref:MYB transcription factor n=1 Tax=Hevea brasiliensis TaxID=3981 RepID=A0A6A6N8P3_HEVBR|nr:hypothetical protein GH714_031401 [Hevea brasiliensis]